MKKKIPFFSVKKFVLPDDRKDPQPVIHAASPAENSMPKFGKHTGFTVSVGSTIHSVMSGNELGKSSKNFVVGFT